jgi:hypothetical protein
MLIRLVLLALLFMILPSARCVPVCCDLSCTSVCQVCQ